MLEAYGKQLADRNLAEDAAVAFVAAGALERALQQYKLAGQWQMAFCLAGEPSMNRDLPSSYILCCSTKMHRFCGGVPGCGHPGESPCSSVRWPGSGRWPHASLVS